MRFRRQRDIKEGVSRNGLPITRIGNFHWLFYPTRHKMQRMGGGAFADSIKTKK